MSKLSDLIICRGVLALISITLLSGSFQAQKSQQHRAEERGAIGGNQAPSIRDHDPSQPIPDLSVSVARLRVPLKARRVYEKAMKTFREGRYVEAEATLDQAMDVYPAFPEALMLRGFIEFSLNQFEPAEQSLQAAVRSDPTYGPAYLTLGSLYNTERRFDEALAAARRAVQLLPDYWPVQYEIARALIGKQQYDQALNVSEAALRANQGTLLHLAKAHALIGLGRYPEAITELQLYLRCKPTGEGSEDAHQILDKFQAAMRR